MKKPKLMGLVAVLAALTLMFGVAPLHAQPNHDLTGRPRLAALNLDLDVIGELAPGVLGLPGEPVTWLITVKNVGEAAGNDVVVTNTVHDTLRIDNTQTTHGTVAVDGQVVDFAIPVLNPGETAELMISTTVLGSPVSGKLVTQVVLAASGPDGTIARHMAAEVFVPTGLPATGYAPPSDNDLPGKGEPSVLVFGFGAISMVSVAAAFVWVRGRRRF